MPEDQSGQANPKLYVPPSDDVREAEERNTFEGQDRAISVADSGVGNDSSNGDKPDTNCVATFVIIVKFDGNCDILYNPNELVGRNPGSVPQRMADPKLVKDTCRDVAEYFEHEAIIALLSQRFPSIMANAAAVAQQAQQEAIIRAGIQNPPRG